MRHGWLSHEDELDNDDDVHISRALQSKDDPFFYYYADDYNRLGLADKAAKRISKADADAAEAGGKRIVKIQNVLETTFPTVGRSLKAPSFKGGFKAPPTVPNSVYANLGRAGSYTLAQGNSSSQLQGFW